MKVTFRSGRGPTRTKRKVGVADVVLGRSGTRSVIKLANGDALYLDRETVSKLVSTHLEAPTASASA